MAAGDSTFAGSIPALYDRHLGPLLFALMPNTWRAGEIETRDPDGPKAATEASALAIAAEFGSDPIEARK